MNQTPVKLINDTIYNHIECSQIEDSLLQTKVVNRLLFVTQNALAYFAYPSINTKRYIHSLGTMHLSAHMFKNSLLNASQEVNENFLDALVLSIENLIQKKNLDISLEDKLQSDDKALYEFMVFCSSEKNKNSYLLCLQALRIAGLLHDVGHFPFSHQVEFALQRIYDSCKAKNPNKKEQEFIKFYEDMQNSDTPLHEAVGVEFVKLLFGYEIVSDDELALLEEIVMMILLEHKDPFFDYKVLHSFIDSTIDADRLDYVNRDMLASGYISGGVDFIRLTKQAVLIQKNKGFALSFFDSEVVDIEHMLQMRFDLYKKIIFNHNIAATDAHLENVIIYLAKQYFQSNAQEDMSFNISMMWRFRSEKSLQKRLDLISQLDENWLITIFKKEYFKIKYKPKHNRNDRKYLTAFEEVLFGKKIYQSIYKNLNELYDLIGFTKIQRYQFRESFGYVSQNRYKILQSMLDQFCKKYEDKQRLLSYRIVSLNIGIDKNFALYDGKKSIKLDEISTIRKRLKKSIQNTVPFYLYCNQKKLTKEMKSDIHTILHECCL